MLAGDLDQATADLTASLRLARRGATLTLGLRAGLPPALSGDSAPPVAATVKLLLLAALAGGLMVNVIVCGIRTSAVSETICGLPGALSMIARVAVCGV